MVPAHKTCPSARCEEGNKLIGIVNAGGEVAYLAPPVEIDADFVRVANEGRSPEARFRFAGHCAESACIQWDGSHCTIVDILLSAEKPLARQMQSGALPRCGIRKTCRWFSQAGPAACAICPYVVTDQAGHRYVPKVPMSGGMIAHNAGEH